MKHLITLLLLFGFSITLKAQDFYKLLDGPPADVIKVENLFTSISNKSIGSELIDAQSFTDGGFTMTFQKRFLYKGKTTLIFNRYFFNKENKLESASTILPSEVVVDEVNKMLQNGYERENKQVLSHKTVNLKVTIYNTQSAGEDQTIFMYTRKEYKTPGN